MTTNTAIATTTSIGFGAIVTLTDGRTLIARNVGDRWTGKMVDVAWFNPETLAVGELVTLYRGTSHRLAIDEALARIEAA